ncbi:helix-turn-helix domain-containing protein [Anaerosinus sp.]|uniref:helix-turn-helix domain-containing protein n=1 Tax=Selenobaculum sp. TaxID=3074374 RepID=UPI003AB16151
MGDSLIQFRGTIFEKGFGQVAKMAMQDEDLLKNSKLLYSYLCTFGNGAFPSRAKICKDLKMSKTSVSNSLANLVQNGYISVEQKREKGRFSHNVYIIEFIKK